MAVAVYVVNVVAVSAAALASVQIPEQHLRSDGLPSLRACVHGAFALSLHRRLAGRVMLARPCDTAVLSG